MQIALRTQMCERSYWLYERLCIPAQLYPLLTRDMVYFAAKGGMEVVQWRHSTAPRFIQKQSMRRRKHGTCMCAQIRRRAHDQTLRQEG